MTATETAPYRSPAAGLRLAGTEIRKDKKFAATMGPDFTLALAGWLEATATDADDLIKQDTPSCGHEDDTIACHCDRSPVWGCDRCGEYLAPGCCQCWDKALSVARAYLNSEEN
jgi:hypothetical protein